ncbi:MAG: hypothetical protein P9X26_04050 [Candidatus Stygibacter frigidus]|nr:hypothetical protein [Candidatus Stygibacter frigidus]
MPGIFVCPECFSHPYLGTDKLKLIIAGMREFLVQSGCEFKRKHKLTDIIIATYRSDLKQFQSFM